MAQFYTKERSIQSASPKIYDDSQRILTEAEQIIESMRALSSIEERQNAALINNLRAHRQREKELNTRNHQMLMDNMRQVQEVQERNDRVNLADKQLKSKQEAEQERRTMETLATLSKAAGQIAGGMVEEGIAQETKKAQEEARNLQRLNPQQFDPEAKLGLQPDLNLDNQKAVADETTAFLAKTSGKDMNFVARMFVSPERLQRIRREVLAGEFASRVERGSLEDYIRQNPNETVTITQNGQVVDIPLSQVSAGQVGSSEDLNRIYSELADKLMKPIKGDADPLIYHKADERIRNYINTRTLQYSDKLTRDSITESDDLKVQQLLLAESPDEMATNAVMFVDQAGVSPYKDRGAALNQITNQILPNTPNPVSFAESIGEREFRHMPGIKIKDTPFGKTLKREALRFERAQEADLLNQSKAQGSQIGDRIFQGSFGDDQLFDAAEYQAGYNAIREKEANGTINFETARQAELKLDSYYQSYSDSTLTKQLIADLSERQELTKPFLDSAFASGQINRSTYDTELQKINALDTVKLPNGKRYSVESIRAQAMQIATDKVGRFDVSGQPKSFTAHAAADLASDLYLQKFKSYSEEFTPEVAAQKAWSDIQSEMLNEEGMFFVDTSDKQRGGIYSRLSVGTHTGAVRMPKAPTQPASEVGTQLRGEGAVRLDDKEFTSVDTNIAAYAAQIKNGNQIKPTAYDQEVADAAGIPLHELLNRRFEALGIKGVEAKEGSFGIIRKAAEISPELQRVLNSPKTWNKLSSVTDRSPNLLPARMGTQAMGFHNASSIARKFGHPNPELIAGIWAAETNEGRNPSKATPGQQIKEIIENNPDLNMFIPYSQLASQLPAVVPFMRKYGDSHNGISGTSKTIARMQSSLVGQPSRLSQAIIGKESGGQSGVTNKDSGALGYGQVMPENVPSWTKEALGRSMTPEAFLNDPQAQVRVVNFKIKQYYDTAIRQGHPPDIAIRMAAAAWYAGPGNMHLYDNTRPQYTNGNRYPSIAEYTKDILRRYKNE